MKRLIRKSNMNKIASWIQLNRDKRMAVPGWGKGDNSKETYFQQGVLSLDTLQNAIGFSNENREWTEDGNGNKFFGNYTEEKWNAFLEDIQANGIQEPIVLNVEVDGAIKIWEGNHRVEAAKQLGINEIPAKVYYMGGSEDDWKIQ